MSSYQGIIAARPERFDATTDPTANDDFTAGWAPGSEWLNTVTGTAWKCFGADRGAAVWKPIVLNGGDVSENTAAATGSPTPRTLAQRAGEFLSVTDFGAKGDGSDATEAFRAALATGKSIRVPAGSYVISGGLTMLAWGQRLVCDARARLFPQGNFDLITLTGGAYNQGVSGLYVEASGMTGGHIIKVADSHKVEINDVMAWEPWNFAYVEQSNTCRIARAWVNAARGGYGVKWYGDAGKRSDILVLSGVNLSGDAAARPTGIEWDGNCGTLQVNNVTLVNQGYGVRVRNTSGGPDPEFGFFNDLEVDFPTQNGVSLEAGKYYFFTAGLYVHGSVNGSGIYVGSGVPSDAVVLSGGKVSGHARYAVEAANPQVATNLLTPGNALGTYTATVRTRSTAFAIDDTAFFSFSGTDPVLNWDTADYVQYDRANNRVLFFVGGAAVVSITGDRITAPLFQIDAGAYSRVVADGQLVVHSMDLGDDYIAYDRTTNTYTFYVGGVAVFRAAAARASFPTLPTSPTGLVSGDLWRDAASGNVIKAVP